MRITVFAPLYPPAFLGGGPIKSIEAIVSQSSDHHDIAVVTRATDLDGSPLPVPPDEWLPHEGVHVRYTQTSSACSYARTFRSVRDCRPQLIYCNSFFDLAMSVVPQLLARSGFWGQSRTLVAVRGEFGRAALNKSKLRKRAFLLAYRLLGLHRKTVWHASSTRERADVLRVMGPRAQVLVRRNTPRLAPTSYEEVEALYSASTHLRAVFLGRLVAHKGLHIVLEALGTCPSPMTLDIYGPEEDPDFASLCRRLAQDVPSHVIVQFKGPLRPEDVKRTLKHYDLLVMPTHGENFGHVIAEALSSAVPVMVGDVTPWTEAILEGGGVLVPSHSVCDWATLLDSYANLDVRARIKGRTAALAAYERWLKEAPGGNLFDDWIAFQGNNASG